MGENLLAMPCMKLLAEKYNVIGVSDTKSMAIFGYYNFLYALHEIKHMYYLSEENIKNTCDKMNELIFQFDIKQWCTHHENIAYIFGKHLNATEYKNTVVNNFLRLSYMESYLQRIGYSPFGMSSYFASPTPYFPDEIKRIVMFQGAREMLRKMPFDVYQLMVNKVYEIYGKEYKIISLQDISYKFNFPSEVEIVNDMIIPDVVNLFSKKVNLMIGPNGGMSVIAHLYRTPIVMFESRVRTPTVVPHFLLNLIFPYEMQSETGCLKNCEARMETKTYGHEIKPFKNIPYVNGQKDFDKLECRESNICPCLNYKEKDIDNILEIIKNNINGPICQRLSS